MSDLKTIVHVESRSLCCNVRKTSATPASPAWVATRICSTYFDFGAASYEDILSTFRLDGCTSQPTFILVPPFTDFSKDDIDDFEVGGRCRDISRN